MNGVEYPCKVEDLIDEGEIGRGRFGSVHRMKHSPSGNFTQHYLFLFFLGGDMDGYLRLSRIYLSVEIAILWPVMSKIKYVFLHL